MDCDRKYHVSLTGVLPHAGAYELKKFIDAVIYTDPSFVVTELVFEDIGAPEPESIITPKKEKKDEA